MIEIKAKYKKLFQKALKLNILLTLYKMSIFNILKADFAKGLKVILPIFA